MNGWHLDKRVPLALIVALIVQTSGAVWWAAGITASIENAALHRARLETSITKIEIVRDDLRDRMVRVETNVIQQTNQMRNLETMLSEILKELRRR